MVGASVYDDKEIDTTSLEFKEMVSDSIKQYIIKNWDQCVQVKKLTEFNRHVVQFSVEL